MRWECMVPGLLRGKAELPVSKTAERKKPVKFYGSKGEGMGGAEAQVGCLAPVVGEWSG